MIKSGSRKDTTKRKQRAINETIEISDKLYDILVNSDCCGFGMDEIIEQGLKAAVESV